MVVYPSSPGEVEFTTPGTSVVVGGNSDGLLVVMNFYARAFYGISIVVIGGGGGQDMEVEMAATVLTVKVAVEAVDCDWKMHISVDQVVLHITNVKLVPAMAQYQMVKTEIILDL